MKKLLLLLLSTASTLNAYDITINNTTGYFVRLWIELAPISIVGGLFLCSQPNHGPGFEGLAPQTKDSWGTGNACACTVYLFYPTFTKEGNLDWDTFNGRWYKFLSDLEGTVPLTSFDARIPTSAGYKNFEIYAEKDANGIPQFHWR